MKRRILSIIMVLSMCLSMLPVPALAAEDTGLCDHHTAHTAECHYAEAVAGTPCSHEHTAECYTAGVLPDGDSFDVYATGEDTNALNCQHQHDDTCGYVAAVEAHDCHFECAECAAPVCDCGTDDPAIHATTCAVYVAPENPVCYCAEKCSDTNIWCDVCGFDYTACTGTDTAAVYAEGTIDLSQYSEGDTINISEDYKIIGDGNEYNISLNIAEDATVIFDVGASGVKLGGQITVADGKTLTLLVAGDAEHTVNGGISLGNASNVVIEGDLDKPNNKLTVTATGSDAGIGANNGVTAGDITIRNARVEATGSGSADSPKVAGAGIGTAKASMGNILIVNSIVTAAGGYYSEYEAHGAAIGMGSDGVSMGNITLIDSEITASHSGEGHASIIGAGPDFAEGDRDGSDIGTMGDIIITNTDLHLSMAESTTDEYAAMIGTADFSGGGLSYSVNMGKIIFTDITQAELDEMIATWYIPSDFAEYGGYVLGLGYWTHVYKYNEYEKHCVGTFGGVWVSDGNGGIVQIGNDDGYYVDCKDGSFVHNFDKNCGGTCSDCDVTYYVVHTMGTAATCTELAVCSVCGESYGDIDADAHSYGDWVSNGDNTHTRTCANDSTHTESGDCSGGTATCTTQAVCTTCKTAYGKLADHTPAENATYTDNGDGTHGFECSVCGETVSAAHDFTGDGVCVCGAVCPHSFTDGVCTTCGIIGGYCGAEGDGTNLVWTLVDGTLTITGTGAMADYDPSDDSPWYTYRNSITALTIPEGVTNIGEFAFWGFTGLKSVTIPASVTKLGYCAFTGSGLEAVTFADESQLTTIDYYAFQVCDELTEITLPAGVGSFQPDWVFWGCSALSDIHVAEGNTTYKDIDGVLYTADGATLMYYPEGKTATSFTTPTGVTTIGQAAFSDNGNIESVTLSEGVTTIGEQAFLFCDALAEVTIPASVTSIGTDAFYGCTALTAVNAPCNWDGSLYTFADTVTVNVAEHTPDENSYTDNGDGTHTAAYSCCGTTVTEEHTGGTATCTTLAVCDLCGESYGELGSHSFDSAGTCTGCQIKAKAKLEAFDFELDKYVPTYYATLPEALAAVTQPTSQVEALADYDGVLELTIDFDGNGYTFSGEITVDEYATIQDGNFTGKVILNYGNIWDGTFQGEVIVKADGYIQGGTFHNTVTVETGGKITDMDSTFKGTVINNGSIYAGNFYSDVTNNGKIYRDELDVSVFYGTLTNNGTIYGGYFSGGKLINAGTVENHCSDSYDYEDGFEYVPAEGGTVTGDHNNTTEANCTSGAICSFCGEYGDKNPNNHDFSTVDDNGKCGCGVTFVAAVDKTVYTTFDDAVANWTDGTTLILLDNVTLTSYITVTAENVTLDLNGKSLSGSNLNGVINVDSGSLTIDDSATGGVIENTEGWGVVVTQGANEDNPGMLTIKGGWLKSEATLGVVVETWDYSKVSIGGDAIIGIEEPEYFWCWVLSSEDNTEITVTGGTFLGETIGRYDTSGTLKISGGVFQYGIRSQGGTLNSLLAEGYAYWQDGKMLILDDSVKEINGAVEIKSACTHETGTTTYADNGDGTHSKTYSCCEATVTEEHTLLTYSASGNVITGSCSKCPAVGTATITAENTTYKGTAQETATVAYSEGWNSGELTVSYVNNVNAGTATASITLGEATASVEFTIAKAEVNLDTLVDPEFATGLVYNGTAQALVIKTGSVEGGTILYSLTYDGEYTSTIPVATEAGRYGVYWLIQGDENHEDILSPGWTQVIIAAKPGTDANVTLGEYDSVYSGTAKEPGIASVVVDGVTLTAGKDYDVSYENNVYAGTAKAVITFKGNYSGTVTETFQISKAPLTVTADDKSMTTGRDLPAFTYTITGFVNGETEAVLTAKPTVSCEANGQTAGTYDITVSGAAADNYEITHVNGALSVVDHQHAWTYTAKDDTITVTCNAEGCPDAEQSITISAVGKTYDGTPVTATLTGSIDGVATPEITYTSNTNAGTHTASITIEGETASVKFTIEKATVTVTADAKSKPYGTDNPTLTYTSEGLLGDDVLTGALETIATKTSNVGEYDITVGSLANSNYTIDFVGAKLTITKAAAPEIQWPTAAALTYGQKLSDSTLTSEDKNGTFAWQDGSIVPTVKNNGYVVVYTPKDTDNYDYTVVELTETIPVTVSKVSATVTTAPTPNTLTYTGEGQYLISAGEAVGGTMLYSLTENGDYTTSIPQGTNAGDYTVWYYVQGDANHNDSAKDSVSVNIAKATVTVTADAKSKPYGTDNPTLTYTSEGLLGGDTLTGALETTATKTSNVGEYDITVGSLANSNYTIDFVGAKLTITKAASSCTAPATVSGLTFNGGNQNLITAGTATGGTMQYSLDGSTWSETIPSGKDAKTYTVYYRVVGDGNHVDNAGGSVSVTIAPKVITNPVIEGIDAQYLHTGSAITPVPTAVKDGNTVIDPSEYTLDYENNINEGTATLKIVDAANGNYTVSGSKTFQIVVHAHVWNYSAIENTITATCSGTIGTCPDAEQSIKISAEGKTYDGTAVAATLTGSIDGVVTPTISYSGNTNAGTYTASITIEGVTASVAFTISKANQVAPNLSKTDETLKGQKNGTITGVTNKMEYATTSGGSYTAITGTTLDNLAAGTYYVRLAADANHNASPDTAVTIAAGEAITVTYDQGTQTASGMPAQLTDLSYGTKLTKPADPTANNTDFAFVGWYKDAACTAEWDFNADTLIAESVTLYAKWKQVYFSVAAAIKDHEGNVYHGTVEVDLMRGNNLIDSVTGTSGSFTFSKHVEAGMYNLVAIYTDDAGEHTKTELIDVDHDGSYELQLPAPGVNSHLDVSSNAETPPVMVGGLDDEAASVKSEADQASGGETVKEVSVTMDVEGKKEAQVNDDVVQKIENAIAEAPGSEVSAVVEYLEIKVNKEVVTDSSKTTTPITETTNVIEIVIPFNFSGRTGIKIIRHHGDTAAALVQDNTKGDGTFYLDTENGYIHIFTKRFSTYAVSYITSYNVTFDVNGGDGSNSNASTNANGTVVLPADPTRSGYTFKGWYTASSGGTKVTSDYVFSGDTTVYAQWTQNYIPPAGGGGYVPSTYSITVEDATNGTVKADRTRTSSGTTVTLTVTPDTGYTLETLMVTTSNGKEVELTNKGNGQYTFKMPSSKVTIKATFMDDNTMLNFFVDVPAGAYYYDAVLWAAESGITSGTSATTFSPDNPCTRAQMATFLWRAAGSPEPVGTPHPFTDIPADAYYAKAVQWAYEQGITGGTSATTYSPDEACTRGQMATFLWRNAGSKAPMNSANQFADVPAEKYYATAVQWAYEQKITSGTSATTFSPDDPCTRAQMVTFLYRFFVK